MKSFITFFREAYLPPTPPVTNGVNPFDVNSLPTGVPIYIGDGGKEDRARKSREGREKSLDINTNSKSNVTSTPATQKLNTSDQNVKDTLDLNLNQEKIGRYANKYYMK
jgi:hypothetical protein